MSAASAFYVAKAAGTRARSGIWLVRTRGRLDTTGLRVLFYHRVSDDSDELAVTPAHFREQMEYLAGKGYEAIDVLTAVELQEAGELPPRTVALTFDDGYLDVAEHALPILSDRGYRATVFVAPAVVDGAASFSWYTEPPPLLDWDDIAGLDREGTLRFEAHSLTHPNLPALDEAAARDEIAGSRDALAERLGREVLAFSYPSGLFGDREQRLVAEAGFRIAVSCEPGVNNGATDPLALRRRQIDARDSLLDFRAKLGGGHDTPPPLRGLYRQLRYGNPGRGCAATADTARRPKVLLLITLAEVGGAQAYVASLLPALTPRFDVMVAAYGEGPLREAAAEFGVRFVPLRHVRRPVRPWRDAAGLVELVRLLKRERPDILHASSSKAGILGRLAAAIARVPVRIFTVHGWAFNAYSGLTSLLFRWADRLVSPLTTMTICVSDNARAAGIEAGTCRAESTVVIRNAVDVAGAPLSTPDHEQVRLIAVGRLKAPKDFVTLVRALATLPDGTFEALIVGEGPDRPLVEAEIERLGIGEHVELAGERSDVPALLAESDLFVLSSTSECLPVCVLEAMAAGLPVVASDVGGVRELVAEGESGLLVRNGKPDELGAALAFLIADPSLRLQFGAAGRARAEAHFDLPAFRRAHVDLYRAELGHRTRVPSPRRAAESVRTTG